MELIALVSSGKGTWLELGKIIEKGDWEKVILVGEEFARKFESNKKFEFINIDFSKDIASIRDDIHSKLKGKINGLEVALSIASGTGKEHIALISALLKIPIGVRLVSLSGEELAEL